MKSISGNRPVPAGFFGCVSGTSKQCRICLDIRPRNEQQGYRKVFETRPVRRTAGLQQASEEARMMLKTQKNGIRNGRESRAHD